ncbi:MAG: glycosyltransferase family 1 protein [Candidatus Abyssobacteria bacterium SURF_5]|uniref:Glycosyltransferase family 1 protein n=1 Tax=Abyssobacteria bacterium (strain SURF_5) TaxID=2093360 RepID=A0A3A4P2V7_ABYX5|nr:MAG: glycosyltransferase family 1 protein [Candidatus Abyssubacteria bacterium SURF_5]
MRIGIDCRYLYDYFTGVGRYTHNLANRISEFDGENEYVLFKNPAVDRIVDKPNFFEVPVKSRPVSFGTWLNLSLIVQRHRLDIFHSLFPVAPLFPACKTVVTVHDLQAVTDPHFSSNRNVVLQKGAEYFYRMSYPLSMNRADKIIAVSGATKRDIVEMYGIDESKIVVVHEAIGDRFYQRPDTRRLDEVRLKYKLPEKFMLYLGNTRPHKNVKGLLESFARFVFLKEFPTAPVLVIAGVKERFFPQLLPLLEQLRIEDRVIFLDYIPDEDLPCLLAMARVFAFLTTKEGFGLPPLEAMASGVPVIASTDAALPEVLGEAAVLCNPHDPRECAQGMLRLWEDEQLRSSLIQKGLERPKFFSWEKAARQTLAVYKELGKR